MSIDLSSLNESQLTAVRWQDGPILVLAGPGSGKTRVLTLRIARLIDETPAAKFRVLGVTFTNKAASEMRTRLDGLLAAGRERAVLTTFHAFAADLLRQHGSHVGLKPDFTILPDQAEREAVLTAAMRAAPASEEGFAPRAAQVLPVISRLLDECVSPGEAERRLAASPHAADVARIYVEYRRRLVSASQLDFGSLLALAVELLEKRPAIAKQVRRIYPYVCVDEFQDTNAAQCRLLVQLVAAGSPNLFVVADDDQLIYEWNGASPARLQEIRSRFNMSALQLPENYRCPPAVIKLANRLIIHNIDRAADKLPLTAHKPVSATSGVVVRGFRTFDEERAWLAESLGRLPSSERPRCAVLARRRKLLEDVVATLTAASVPAYIAVRKTEFQSAPYRWLHAMLRLANARQDREQLRRICRAFADLEGVVLEVEDVAAGAAIDSGDLLRAWTDAVVKHPALETHTRRLVGTTRSTLLDRLDYWAFVRAALEWFGSVRRMPAGGGDAFDEFDDEAEIWTALVAEIGGHYVLGELGLHGFLQEMDLRAKEKPPPPNAVRCLTIHASKGMEFRHVFLIGLVEDELPSWAAGKKGADAREMREERRNCFVAITRAEETLALTYAASYYGYAKSPSRFLAEMGIRAG